MMITKFFKEFRSFAERGNAIDMAIGIIIGSVMTSVVNSLVKDIIMPPIGLLIGGVDFSQIFFVISGGNGAHFHTYAEAAAAGATTINLGVFINTLISFIITMFAAFLIVRMVNKMKSKQAVTTRVCPYCKSMVDITATKCAYCCSGLTPGEVKAAEESDLAKGLHKLKKLVKIKKIKK